jgi:hypothetical protein
MAKSFLLYVQCDSIRHWTYTKKRLSFCTVTQDGDDEGSLKLTGMPTKEQAEEIRHVLRIHQRGATPSADQFNRSDRQEGFQAPTSTQNDAAGTGGQNDPETRS